MKNIGLIAQSCIAALALAFVWANPLQADEDFLPPEQQQGEIHYRSGGIGSDESAALKAVRGDYALNLTFSSVEEGRGAYESNVHVSIRNPDGSEVLEAVAEGPYLLVNLPAGKYTVVATARGEPRAQPVTIVPGQHKALSFSWTFAPRGSP